MSHTWIDSHCHLSHYNSDSERLAAMQKSQQAGVTGWVLGGVGPSDWPTQQALMAQFPGQVFSCFGIHPWWAIDHTEPEIYTALESLAKQLPSAHLLGEVGLDAYRTTDIQSLEWNRQRLTFEGQIQLLSQSPKPLVVHAVRAHADVVTVLKSHVRYLVGGIVHRFSGNKNDAKAYLDLGFMLSFGPRVSEKTKDILTVVPEDFLLIETDSPNDIAPSSAELVTVAKKIAALTSRNEKDVLSKSTENVKRLFGHERNITTPK